jgi:hypothetical protein
MRYVLTNSLSLSIYIYIYIYIFYNISLYTSIIFFFIFVFYSIFQLKVDLSSEQKERFESEHKLQACLVELRLANENVSESRGAARGDGRRLAAAAGRERQERGRASLQHYGRARDLRRDAEQMAGELCAERAARARDVRGGWGGGVLYTATTDTTTTTTPTTPKH